MTGADIIAKEGNFLKQMLVVIDYYKKSPPVKQEISDQISFLSDFLEHKLNILSGTDQFYNFVSMKKCLEKYGHYLANWDGAPADFKTLVNFLTKSSAPGPHREALKAFNEVRLNFLTQTLVQEIEELT